MRRRARSGARYRPERPPPPKDAGETYGRINEPFAPPAMLARVRSGSTTLWGWQPLDLGGCTGEFVAAGGDLVQLQWYEWAYFANETGVVAYDCWTDPTTCAFERFEEAIQLAGSDETAFTPVVLVSPTWAMFWATAFSTFRRSLLFDESLYGVLHTGGTFADRSLGGWPTANFRGPTPAADKLGSDSRKFTLAHEWGHLQTIVSGSGVAMGDLDYAFNPEMCSDDPADENYDPDCMLTMQHAFDSLEFQPTASVEGFANWYAISVWNAESQDEAVYIRAGIPEFFSANTVFEGDYVPVCSTVTCPPGVANEMDWALALREFQARQTNPDPTVAQVGAMLRAVYPWPDEPTAFWAAFLASQITVMPIGHIVAFADIGGIFAIDQ